MQSKGLSSLLQHHSSKPSILRRSAFFMVQLSHPYMTTGKTIALTRRTFVGKVMSLLFNMLSRLLITFLSRKVMFSWKKSYDQPRQHIKKQRHYFVNKGPSSKAMVFPVIMYGCESWTVKKAERRRIDAFELWCWRRLLRLESLP